MRKVKVNGNSVEIPTGWHEVSYNDAIKIIDEEMSNIDVFSLFSSYPSEDIKKEKNIDTVYYFMEGFPFLKSLPEGNSLPISVNIDGMTTNIPLALDNDMLDFGECPVGVIEDMKAFITSKTKELLDGEEREITALEEIKMKPYIVAMYLQSITDEYDNKKALELANKVKEQLSFKEVIFMGNFFLSRLLFWMNESPKPYPKRKWIRRMRKQVYRILINLLDSMLR